jgi:hypothetical protein
VRTADVHRCPSAIWVSTVPISRPRTTRSAPLRFRLLLSAHRLTSRPQPPTNAYWRGLLASCVAYGIRAGLTPGERRALRCRQPVGYSLHFAANA